MFWTHCIENNILAWLHEYYIAQFSNFELFPLEQFSCKPIDGQGAQFVLNWIGFHLILQFFSKNQIVLVLFVNYLFTKIFICPVMLVQSYKCYARSPGPQQRHESKKRFQLSSFEFLQRRSRKFWQMTASCRNINYHFLLPASLRFSGCRFFFLGFSQQMRRVATKKDKQQSIRNPDIGFKNAKIEVTGYKMTVVNRSLIMLK